MRPQNKTLDDAWAVDLMNPFNITGASEYFPLAAPGLHVFGEQAKGNFFGNQGMVRLAPVPLAPICTVTGLACCHVARIHSKRSIS